MVEKRGRLPQLIQRVLGMTPSCDRNGSDFPRKRIIEQKGMSLPAGCILDKPLTEELFFLRQQLLEQQTDILNFTRGRIYCLQTLGTMLHAFVTTQSIEDGFEQRIRSVLSEEHLSSLPMSVDVLIAQLKELLPSVFNNLIFTKQNVGLLFHHEGKNVPLNDQHGAPITLDTVVFKQGFGPTVGLVTTGTYAGLLVTLPLSGIYQTVNAQEIETFDQVVVERVCYTLPVCDITHSQLTMVPDSFASFYRFAQQHSVSRDITRVVLEEIIAFCTDFADQDSRQFTQYQTAYAGRQSLELVADFCQQRGIPFDSDAIHTLTLKKTKKTPLKTAS